MNFWTVFLISVVSLMALDFGVLSKYASTTMKSYLLQVGFWVLCGVGFAIFTYYAYATKSFGVVSELTGTEAVSQWAMAYLLEQAMSVDNLFVIGIIFTYFKLQTEFQHKVLFWGIVGVFIFRGLAIGLGVELIQRISWINYIFGAFLLYTAFKLWNTEEEDNVEFEQKPIVRFINRFVPTTYVTTSNFFVKLLNPTTNKYVNHATQLFVALMVVETTDITFALDSIPATLSATKDIRLAFSSNIYAILGLRAMFFVLNDMKDKFIYLEKAIIFILAFIGFKMLTEHFIHIPVVASLAVIIVSLVVGIYASLYGKKTTEQA